MVTVQKFMFDRRFDDPNFDDSKKSEADDDLADDVEEEEEEEEIIPTFSQEELDAARAQGFADGKEEGIREAGAAIEQRSLETLEAIRQTVAQLFEIQEAENDRMAGDAMLVALSVVRKLFPEMAARQALSEIEGLFETVIGRLRTAPSVTVQINDTLAETAASRLSHLSEASGFEGQLKIVSSGETPVGDCRITWGDGGAERDSDALWAEIDRIIAENMAEPTAAPKAKTDTPLTVDQEVVEPEELVNELETVVNGAPDDGAPATPQTTP